MKPAIAVPATVYLVYRAWSRRSLTPLGIVAAAATAVAHAVHPWSVFYGLLAAFFLAGTAVTKVKHNYKSTLTLSSAGGTPSPSAPQPRNATQVLANSLAASLLILAHTAYLRYRGGETCLPPLSAAQTLGSLLPYAILAQYTSVAADTFSSELGILASSPPLLLSSLLLLRVQRVPHGTNGGVTLLGLGAGVLGAAIVGSVGTALMPFCGSWALRERINVLVAATAWGALGSVVDSLLGAWLQASVVDRRAGKIVESEGGQKVLFRRTADASAADKKDGGSGGRVLVSGRDILSNNGVNFVMASTMSLGALFVLRLAVT